MELLFGYVDKELNEIQNLRPQKVKSKLIFYSSSFENVVKSKFPQKTAIACGKNDRSVCLPKVSGKVQLMLSRGETGVNRMNERICLRTYICELEN